MYIMTTLENILHQHSVFYNGEKSGKHKFITSPTLKNGIKSMAIKWFQND